MYTMRGERFVHGKIQMDRERQDIQSNKNIKKVLRNIKTDIEKEK